MNVKQWSAARSQDRINLTGLDDEGTPVKIEVDLIEPRNGKIVAVDAEGTEHTLEQGDAPLKASA